MKYLDTDVPTGISLNRMYKYYFFIDITTDINTIQNLL